MQLAQLYEQLDDQARKDLARRARIAPGYLWQLGTHWKGKKPSVDVIRSLVDADSRLTADELVREFAAEGAVAPADLPVSHVGASPCQAAS